MLTDEDRKAAEDQAIEWCGYPMPITEENRYLLLKHEVPPEYVGLFLAGIKHERKRHTDLDVKSRRLELALMTRAPCISVKCEFPVEQVGEKHWRIKE